MRAAVERSHLLRSLSHVHRVVERRNTIPILSNVLIHASKNNKHQCNSNNDSNTNSNTYSSSCAHYLTHYSMLELEIKNF